MTHVHGVERAAENTDSLHVASGQCYEAANEVACIVDSLVEAVVHYPGVELCGAAHLVCCAVYSHVDDLGCLRTAEFEASA